MKDYLKFYAIANPAVELFKHALMDAFEKGYELGHEDGLEEKPEKIQEMQTEYFEKGVKKAEENAKEVRDKAIEEAYFSALKNAWECAEKIVGMSEPELDDCFGEKIMLRKQVFEKYSASEAMKMINEYEKKQPEMTRDEARAIIDIVFKCKRRIIDTHYCEGTSCAGCEFHIPAEKIEKAREVLKN